MGASFSVYLIPFRERSKCPQCGRTFERGPEWGYVFKSADYCSYRCMRAAERAWQESREYKAIESELNARDRSQEQKIGEAIEEKIRNMFRSGSTLRQISDETGIHICRIRSVLMMSRDLSTSWGKALKPEECLEIRRRKEKGATIRQLMADYKLSKNTIYRVLREDY